MARSVSFSFFFIAVAAPLLAPPDPKAEGSFRKIGRPSDPTPHPPSEIAPLGTLPFQIARMFEHRRNPVLPTDFD